MILTHQQIAERAPAAVSDRAAPSRSERYGHINTMRVVTALEGHGYVPVDADQAKARQRDPRYVEHRVVMRPGNSMKDAGDQAPQIVILNSHNGRSVLRLRAGLYRFVCANGLIIGDDTMNEALGHWQSAAAVVDEFVGRMATDVGRVFGKIEQWGNVQLTEGQRRRFAEEAARLRFGESAPAYDWRSIIEPRRAEDDRGDLWAVFNRAQENLTKGGLQGRNANNRAIQSRKLTGINADVAFNDNLWRLADAFA